MEKEQVAVHIHNSFLDDFCLSYVKPEEKEIIKKRMGQGISIACAFKEKATEKTLFCAVIDFEPDCIHVREVGGFFGKIHQFLNAFCEGLAKFYNCSQITFNTERRAVEKWAEKSGFERMGNKEFLRSIN